MTSLAQLLRVTGLSLSATASGPHSSCWLQGRPSQAASGDAPGWPCLGTAVACASAKSRAGAHWLSTDSPEQQSGDQGIILLPFCGLCQEKRLWGRAALEGLQLYREGLAHGSWQRRDTVPRARGPAANRWLLLQAWRPPPSSSREGAASGWLPSFPPASLQLTEGEGGADHPLGLANGLPRAGFSKQVELQVCNKEKY